MKKVLTIGGAMYDTFIEYEKVETFFENDVSYVALQAGKKIEVDTVFNHCGGGAPNSAISFAHAGFEVEAFFKIGDDLAGEFILNRLNTHNIVTSNVIKTSALSTGHSFIMSHPEGNRPILAYRGANLTMQEEDVPKDSVAYADQLYITSLNGKSSSVLLPLVMLAKKYKKNSAVNPGTHQLCDDVDVLRTALPYIDTLILNSHEAQLLMASLIKTTAAEKNDAPDVLHLPLGTLNNCFSLTDFFRTIHQCGPSVVVVTNGAEGVYVSDKNSVFFHPSIKISHVISTVGAGDAFSSTFISYLLHNYSIEDALRAGIINSASVIQHVGAQTGLLNKKDIDDRLLSFDKNLVQRYSLIL